MHRTSNGKGRSGVHRDTKGEVFVEYLIVLAVVFIPLAQTLVATGPSIVKNYQSQRSILLSINP